jgi:hypothetical protein
MLRFARVDGKGVVHRFVLLDAFVRFLTNALLAAILTGPVIAQFPIISSATAYA